MRNVRKLHSVFGWSSSCLQPAYSSLGYPVGTFCNAERACERVLSLPLFPSMTAEQVNYVATSVLDVVGKKTSAQLDGQLFSRTGLELRKKLPPIARVGGRFVL
jgi:DegT/DnrJ/EryC1/StrS aminotransferase family